MRSRALALGPDRAGFGPQLHPLPGCGTRGSRLACVSLTFLFCEMSLVTVSASGHCEDFPEAVGINRLVQGQCLVRTRWRLDADTVHGGESLLRSALEDELGGAAGPRQDTPALAIKAPDELISRGGEDPGGSGRRGSGRHRAASIHYLTARMQMRKN